MTTVLPLLLALSLAAQAPAPRAVPNDNRVPAGARRGDTLALRLVARPGEWHPDGDAAPGVVVQTFAEEGGPPRIPGPLLRAREGTVVRAAVRNALGDTLRVYGLHARPRAGTPDTTPLVIAPGATGEARFALDAPGTYLYWGTTTRRAALFRTGEDAQLSGAIVVDSARARGGDRVFVISGMSDTVHRVGLHRTRILVAINGRSWPNTERFEYAVGDTVRWRLINASADVHPMHLHGFYFRVTSRGDAVRDTIYAPRGGQPAGDLAVTEALFTAMAMSLEWVPERAGNWLFHCHIPEHFGARGPLGMPPPAGAAHDHAAGGMSGLVLGVTVRPRADVVAARDPRPAENARRLRLLVRPNVGSTDSVPFYGYAIHERGAEPPADTGLVGAPPLDLVRGEPVRITVVNRLAEPTAVHWHGIELDSYYDGVPGFSGADRRTTPLVAPNDSFEVRFTPPRAGTFIYHTHADETRQQHAGLAGALIVREPGTTRDPATDIPIVVTSPTEFALNRRGALFNGRASPPPLTMQVGQTYRLRLIEMSVPRAAVTVDLLRGDSLLAWRPVAKDGADLPPWARAPQPSRAFITVGETYDYEFTPDAPGDLTLEVRFGLPRVPIPTAGFVRAATWPIRVVAHDASPPQDTVHRASTTVAVPGGCSTPRDTPPDAVGCHVAATESLGALPAGPLYWHLDAFPSRAAAEAARRGRGAVAEAHGRAWLFTIADSAWRPGAGERVARVGPLPVTPGRAYAAHYIEGVVPAAARTPVHRHAGPEAWYVLGGAQCLETPSGFHVVRAGEGYVVPEGAPMLLSGVEPGVRKSLALVLHDASQPWTIPAPEWTPKGVCPR